MNDKARKITDAYMACGIPLTYDDEELVYGYCLRKMEVAKVENPEEYIDLLFPDEIKDYLFRAYVNATAWLRMNGLEVSGDV